MNFLPAKTSTKVFLLGVIIASLVLFSPALAAPQPEAITVPNGYTVEAIASNLSLPTTAIFDGNNLVVAESGFGNAAAARVLQITLDGTVKVLASTGLIGPVNGLLKVGDKLYISHKGKVSVLENGTLKDIVTGLPSEGDHQNNNIVLGKDGKIYLGQGTRTNAGVVGEDNFLFGWLEKSPQLAETPCQDITLTGVNFPSSNPLTKENDDATTGAYKPFSTDSSGGEVVKGNPKCGGSVARFDQDGANFELVAWGLRNPFGLDVDKNGDIWATFHGADVRGSRPVYNDFDYLVKVTKDAWFGWPDYFANGKPATDTSLKASSGPQPGFLWKTHPPLTKPFAVFQPHEGANGLAFAPKEFGFEGDAFVALFGSFEPITTGSNLKLMGFRVARVDMKTGEEKDFAANKVAGPSYINRQGGFNRPSDVVFAPDGSLYITDWGEIQVTTKGIESEPTTGVVWRIYPDALAPARPNGPVVVSAAVQPKATREPLVKNSVSLLGLGGVQTVLLLIGAIIVIIILLVLLLRRNRPRQYRY